VDVFEEMVGRDGIEPPTPGFSGVMSLPNLSYVYAPHVPVLYRSNRLASMSSNNHDDRRFRNLTLSGTFKSVSAYRFT